MLHINRATVLGYAGGDAKRRSMQTLVPGSGEDTVSFSIATTRRWKDKDGKPGEATEWHRVAVFGPLRRAGVGDGPQGRAGAGRGPAEDPRVQGQGGATNARSPRSWSPGRRAW